MDTNFLPQTKTKNFLAAPKRSEGGNHGPVLRRTILQRRMAVESRQLSKALEFGEKFNVRLILWPVGGLLGGKELCP
jgi:hypothetical protein